MVWLAWFAKLRFLPGSCQLEAARHPNCASKINTTAVHLGHRFQHPRLNNAPTESNNEHPPNMFIQSSLKNFHSHRNSAALIQSSRSKQQHDSLLHTNSFTHTSPTNTSIPCFQSPSGETLPPHPIQLAIGPDTSARAAPRLATHIHSSKDKRRAQLANKLLAADGTGSCGKSRRKEEEKRCEGIIPA